MTCIVGFIDRENDCVWMGADSLGSNGYTKSIHNQPKLFRYSVFKNVLMGSTTTFRHIDLLKYSETLFPEIDWYKKTDIDHKYMVTKFIPNLINLFDTGIKHTDVKDHGASFIIGIKNKLYEIQTDYSVVVPEIGFCSVGSGEDVAMGSLFTTQSMDIPAVDRIKLALEAAESRCCGVQRPFLIMNTKDENEIVIKGTE